MLKIRLGTCAKAVIAAFGFATIMGSACAQTAFPNQPIKFVIGFGPGSATDLISRAAGQGMSAAMGQPVVVENKVGALSTIAAEFVARAKPDGYTLLIGANSGLSIGPAGLVSGIRYDPVNDFVPVGSMVQTPYILLVDPRLQVSSLSALLALMKADPSKRNCSAGNANTRVYCELFKRRSQLDITTVAFKSNPDASMAVMGGQVPIQFSDIVSALPRIRSGQLKALATMEGARNPTIPDVPTAAEAGWTGVPFNTGWIAMVAPAHTPAPVVARLNKELNASLNKPELRNNLEQNGYRITSGTPEELGAYIKEDFNQWKKLIRELGLQPEG